MRQFLAHKRAPVTLHWKVDIDSEVDLRSLPCGSKGFVSAVCAEAYSGNILHGEESSGLSEQGLPWEAYLDIVRGRVLNPPQKVLGFRNWRSFFVQNGTGYFVEFTVVGADFIGKFERLVFCTDLHLYR